MKVLAINKISCSLKMKRFNMPNAPYSNRWRTFCLSSEKSKTNVSLITKILNFRFTFLPQAFLMRAICED
jgi:hypothetical protein